MEKFVIAKAPEELLEDLKERWRSLPLRVIERKEVVKVHAAVERGEEEVIVPNALEATRHRLVWDLPDNFSFGGELDSHHQRLEVFPPWPSKAEEPFRLDTHELGLKVSLIRQLVVGTTHTVVLLEPQGRLVAPGKFAWLRKWLSIEEAGDHILDEPDSNDDLWWHRYVPPSRWQLVDLWRQRYTAREVGETERINLTQGTVQNVITRLRQKLVKEYGKELARRVIPYHS